MCLIKLESIRIDELNKFRPNWRMKLLSFERVYRPSLAMKTLSSTSEYRPISMMTTLALKKDYGPISTMRTFSFKREYRKKWTSGDEQRRRSAATASSRYGPIWATGDRLKWTSTWTSVGK